MILYLFLLYLYISTFKYFQSGDLNMNLLLNNLSKFRLKKTRFLLFTSLSIFLCSAILINAHAQPDPVASSISSIPVIHSTPDIPGGSELFQNPVSRVRKQVQITANFGYQDANQNQYQTSASSPQFFIDALNPDLAISQGGITPYIDLYLVDNTERDDVRDKNTFNLSQPARFYTIASNTIKHFNLRFENKTGKDDWFDFRAKLGNHENYIIPSHHSPSWNVTIRHNGEIIPKTGLEVLNNETITLNIEVISPEAPVWDYNYINNSVALTYTQQNDDVLARGMIFVARTKNADQENKKKSDHLLIAFKPKERIEQIAIIPTRSNAETYTNLLNGTKAEHDVGFQIINTGNTILRDLMLGLGYNFKNGDEANFLSIIPHIVIIDELGEQKKYPIDQHGGRFAYHNELYPNKLMTITARFKLPNALIIPNPVERNYYRFNIGLTGRTNTSISKTANYNYRIVWPKVQIEQAAFKVKTCENNYNDIQDLNPQDLLSSNDLLEEKSCLMMKYTVTNLTDHEFRPENIKLGIQIPNGLMPVSPMSTLYYDRSESSPSINPITGRYEINLSPASLSYYDSFIDRSRNIIEVYFKLKQDSDSTY